MKLKPASIAFLCAIALIGCQAETESKNPTSDASEASDTSDSSDVTDAADMSEASDTSDPSDMDEPSDTADATDSTDPAETSDPADMDDPSDTSDAADPTDPAETSDPADMDEPSDTSDAADPTDPAETSDPADMDEPSDTSDAADPTDPAETSDPADMDDPSDTSDAADMSDESDATDDTDPSLPGCEGTLSFLSDGYCDASNNNEACNWDGGDCCPSTCINAAYTCGGYVDPVTGDNFDCRNPSACENTDEGCSECAPGCELDGIGDGTCNPFCYNAQCDYDTPEDGVSDCSCTEVNLNEDCVGECFGDNQLSWAEDSFCDDGTYGLDLNCTTWEFDGGACEETTDPTDTSDPSDVTDPSDPADASDTSDPADPSDIDSSCNENLLGDSWCDESNNTEACGWDNGDCCASTCVDSSITCGLNAPYICLDPQACENGENGCAEDESLSCEERELNEDCVGLCFPDNYLDWVGDGECDVGQFGLAFNCPAWSYDDGDCEAPDPGDERENVTITVTVDYYFTQSTWIVENSAGEMVGEERFFTTFDETQSIPIELEAGEYCVNISDSNADGGVSGDVSVNGIIEASWDADDYTDSGSFCFTVE